jgi:glutaconate CoA-transferase subunit A
MNKILSMKDAVARHVHDGDSLAIEGFTAFICFSAAHEIIRQRRRELTLCRMTPDLIYDQMIAAGCASKLVFSYLGNPGVGSLHAVRRAVEKGIPGPLEIEEYSHFGMVGRYTAGAAGLPFFPLRSYLGADLAQANPRIQFVADPYGTGEIAVVPPLNPDVAIIHAQRADESGNTQLWGLLGMQKEAAFAARRVIIVVEEIVDEAVIRSDPNRTLIPNLVVDAVVHQPYGAHPSYVQGYYDRDNPFYLAWDKISRDHAETEAWLEEWVFGVDDWTGYLDKLAGSDPDIWDRLAPGEALSQPVNYGIYG